MRTRPGRTAYSIHYVIVGLVLGACPVRALDPASSFKEYTATTWAHRDGLRSTFIRSIVQTADGYIWLGTTDGLFRFDGVRFVQWHTKEQRGLGLVNALCAARDGSLWVGTQGGIVGRVHGEHLVSFRSGAGSGAAVQGILESGDGAIWVATRDRLRQYRPEQQFSAPAEVSLPSDLLSGPLQDSTGSIWLSTEDGVERLGESGLTKILSGRMWLSLDSAGTIWATREDGASEPAAPRSDLSRPPTRLNIHTILHDSRGTTWIGTFGTGLFRVHPGGETLEHWTQRDGLADDSVSSLFEDREHNLWIGTRNGLQRLHDSKVTNITSRDGLASDEIVALASAATGSVWAVTSRGINRIDHGRHDLYLKGFKAMAIASDRLGRLWAGTTTGVVRLTNSQTESMPLSPELTHVTAIAVDGHMATPRTTRRSRC
jgi:ligand-binding sensor domain-containing protein